jgi:predicted nucleic acid-binding protein
MKSKEELLEELCVSQFKTLKFLNKVMFDTVNYERSLPETEQNTELLNFAWETNDIICDCSGEEIKISAQLKERYNFDLKNLK